MRLRDSQQTWLRVTNRQHRFAVRQKRRATRRREQASPKLQRQDTLGELLDLLFVSPSQRSKAATLIHSPPAHCIHPSQMESTSDLTGDIVSSSLRSTTIYSEITCLPGNVQPGQRISLRARGGKSFQNLTLIRNSTHLSRVDTSGARLSPRSSRSPASLSFDAPRQRPSWGRLRRAMTSRIDRQADLPLPDICGSRLIHFEESRRRHTLYFIA